MRFEQNLNSKCGDVGCVVTRVNGVLAVRSSGGSQDHTTHSLVHWAQCYTNVLNNMCVGIQSFRVNA